MAIKINDILIVILQYQPYYTFIILFILYFYYSFILSYVEIYIPLVENYKYICRNLHTPCRFLQLKSFHL